MRPRNGPSPAAASIHDRVLEASARSYQLSGHRTLLHHRHRASGLVDQTFDLVLPDLGRVEEVETARTIHEMDISKLRGGREAGLEVWVLAPLAQMGTAHARLRGTVDRILPWWIKGGRVRFGGPRLP